MLLSNRKIHIAQSSDFSEFRQKCGTAWLNAGFFSEKICAVTKSVPPALWSFEPKRLANKEICQKNGKLSIRLVHAANFSAYQHLKAPAN
jgi:hypothetical protein